VKNRGFTIVEALLIVVVVAIITTLGFVAYNQFIKPKLAQTQTTAAPTSVTSVKSVSDLDKASSDLQAIDLTDSSDTKTLDTQTSSL
jgi:Tfp pilus assembly major pilin PilA